MNGLYDKLYAFIGQFTAILKLIYPEFSFLLALYRHNVISFNNVKDFRSLLAKCRD